MTAAYLDADAADEIFNTPPGILAWGAIAHQVDVVPAATKRAAPGLCLRLAAGELARRPCPRRRK